MIARGSIITVVLSALVLAWPGRFAAAQPPASLYFTLDNGLQVFLQEKHDLPLTAVTLAIDLGSKDETAETSGYAHLLEHMLLFGAAAGMESEARLAELRGRGIAHNAHTDHDLMTFEVSCPAAESAWAVEHLRQTVFFGRFAAPQLESEKRIILEEVLQLRDDPLSRGRMLVMQQLFAGHPYGQPVHGDGSAIRSATVEQLQAFAGRRLVPAGCALALVGDFTLAEMEREIRGHWQALAKGAAGTAAVPLAGRLEKNSEQRIEMDVNESHLFIAWRAPEFNHEQRVALTLLTHILGRGLNPLLNGVLRGGRPLAEQLDMSYVPLRSGGIVQLHLTLKEKNIRSAKNELSRFLSQLTSFNFGREDFQQQYQSYVLDFLQSAKNQMAFDTENYREADLNLSVAVARFLLLNTSRGGGSYLESVDKISSSDLRRAAGKYLSGKKWAVLAIVPLAGEKK